MTGILLFVCFLFLLQVVTNIVVIVSISKSIKLNKQSKVNLNHIFEGFVDESIKSQHI